MVAPIGSSSHRWSTWLVAATSVAVTALAGCGLAGEPPSEEAVASPSPPAVAEPSRPAPSPAPERAERTASASPVPEAVTGYRSPRETDAVAEPTTVRIPRIGVDSALDRLGRNPDDTVEVPDDFSRAGWYADGVRPGQRGGAVLLGHVDSRAGPAVFYRVAELEPGDEVLIDRDDGSTATFVVDRIEQHDKDAFPTESVYFPTLEPTLALVTCGGEFDRAAGSYRDNVIAFASLRE